MASGTIPFSIYREKVLGCWLGKAVGGTLGGPVEGKPGPLSLTYYDPVPDQMLPNDDLDLQIVWLEAIRRQGLPVDRHTLADAWLEHIHLWPDEYGVASRNLAQGLYPPVSGRFDNGFTAGMGAAIRTEIWACLAPGEPELAAALAREDACVDHADEGVYAAEYLAALESAAFVENDRGTLLDIASAEIPSDCRVSDAISDTARWWWQTQDWMEVRKRILAEHGRPNFTDVAQNLAFIILGWLAGDDDFSKAICTAVNCGKDTDCTGATLGALLGVLNPGGIGEEWLEPIGRDLVLSPGMVGMHYCATLDKLTDQVSALAIDVLEYYDSDVVLTDVPSFADERANMSLPRHILPEHVMLSTTEPTQSLVATEPLIVHVTYPDNVALLPGWPSRLHVQVLNPTDNNLVAQLKARVPDGWTLDDSDFRLNLRAGEAEALDLNITPPPADALRAYLNPLDLNFGVSGLRWTVTAGLVTTIPWLRWPLQQLAEESPRPAGNAEIIETFGHFQSLPDGPYAFVAEFKLPYSHILRYVVQAPREVSVWLDGEEINYHNSLYCVPAIHRARETGEDVQKHRGWHRLTIAVGDGDGGELFVGIGDGQSWDWLRDVEWRIP